MTLLEAGASIVCCDEREASLRLAGSLLSSLGMESGVVSKLCREHRKESELEDIRVMETARRSRQSNNQATFISSSGYRFNSPDTKNDMAKAFMNLAQTRFKELLWMEDKQKSVSSVEDSDYGEESMYKVADKTLVYKEPKLGESPTPVMPKTLDGVDGVDFCLMPETKEEEAKKKALK